VVDARTREQNRSLLQSMSSEELAETMESVESVLGKDLFEKLMERYKEGRGLRTSVCGGNVQSKLPVNMEESSGNDGEGEEQLPAFDNSGAFDLDDTYGSRQPTDLVLLCRSKLPGQRVMAYRRLKELLLQGSTRSGESFPRATPIVLRCGVDDTNISVLAAALDALLVFLGGNVDGPTTDVNMDEWEADLFGLYRGHEAVPPRLLRYSVQSARTDDSDTEEGEGIPLSVDHDAELALRVPARGMLKVLA
jgi:hypothetical protein